MNFCERKSIGGISMMPALYLAIIFLSGFNIFGNSIVPRSTPEPDVKSLRKQAAKAVKQGKFDEAEAAFKRAIAKRPADVNIQLDLAHLYLKQQRLSEAYNIAFPIASADQNNAYAYAIVGSALLSAGRFEEVRPILVTALAKDEDEALAWASLGMLEFYENNLEESLNCLRRAVDIEGSEPDYLFALAQTAGRSEQFKEAADAYRRFLRTAQVADQERRDRIVGIINFLEFLGQRSSIYSLSGLGGKDSVVIPVTVVNERPVISIRVNNKTEPLNFVIDTGSGMSVISESAARKLGIDPVTRGGVGSGIGGDGKFDIVFGFIREIEIGDVSISNIPVYIRKFNSNAKTDGYIGLSLISKFLTTIDYGAGTFELRKATRVAHSDQRSGMLQPVDPDEISLPLRLTSSGFLSGEVVLADHAEPFNFIVDTGASTTVLAKDLMSLNAFRQIEQQGTVHVIGAAGITYGVASYIVPSIRFGSNVQTDVSAIALDLGIINQTAGYVQSGILGGNFLSKYRVTFDFQRSRVKLSPTVAEVTVDPAPLTQ